MKIVQLLSPASKLVSREFGAQRSPACKQWFSEKTIPCIGKSLSIFYLFFSDTLFKQVLSSIDVLITLEEDQAIQDLDPRQLCRIG